MAWASTADTLALTGVTVDDALLAQAQGVIELYSGVTEDNETELSSANVRMLKAAVAYQAAWMEGQVDVTTRTDVSQLNQDGMSVRPAGADALLLAPLARRALDRLSWLRKRGLRFRRDDQRRYGSIEAYQDAWLRDDTADGWRSL